MTRARELARVSAWVCAIGVSGAMAVAHAQNPLPARLSFEHDGQGVTGFALYAQPEKGKAIRIDLGLVMADGNGGRSVAIPSLPDGTYALSIAAYNSAGESSRIAASPARIAMKNSQMAVKVPPATAVSAAPASKAASDPSTPSSPSSAKASKKGGLRRLWGAVVGEDD